MIKYYEAQYGIVSQVVLEQTIRDVIEKNRHLTMGNIIMKANMKLGGLNYIIKDQHKLSVHNRDAEKKLCNLNLFCVLSRPESGGMFLFD